MVGSSSLSFAATAAIIIIAVVTTDNRNRHNVLALSLSSPQTTIRIGGIDRYCTCASSSRYSSSSSDELAKKKSRRGRSGRRMHRRTFGPRCCDSIKLNPRSSSSSLWQTNNEDGADESSVATIIATSTIIFNQDLERERSMEQRSDTARQLASSLSTNGDMCKQHSNDDNNYNNNNNNNKDSNKERKIAILVLLTVPISWGTYTPVVKYMYDKITPSMPGFIFSTGYYIVAALTLRSILLVVGLLSSKNSNNKLLLLDNNNVIEQEKAGGNNNNNNNNNINNDLITKRGGLELGSYLFIGNGLQVIGLQSVPADRAAFLVQLTTVMVPFLSAITAGTLLPIRTYVACLIAFIGVVVMGADGSSSGSGGSGGDDGSNNIMVSSSNDSSETITTAIQSMQIVSQGDILCILAALAYTMHVVRLGKYAPQTNPLKLAAAKATTEALLGIILCSCLAYVGSSSSDLSQLLGLPTFVNQMGSSISEYFSFLTTELTTTNNGGSLPKEISSSLVISIGAILWTGWVTCAYTIYAQSFGQRNVGPADSNLIYTTQPLFSSLFAYLLLGETLGSYGYVGATLIGISLWLVPSSKQKDP